MVSAVTPDGPASFLRPGDAVAGAGGRRTATPEDLLSVFRRERLAPEVLLQVVREGRLHQARLVP